MIVKAIKNFGDITTGETYEKQAKIVEGQVFECDDELAQTRIKKGLVVEATDEEARQYVDSLEIINEDDLKPSNEGTGDTDTKSNDGQTQEGTGTNIDDNAQDIEKLSFKELQEIAKSKDLKYVGVSKENLIKSIN